MSRQFLSAVPLPGQDPADPLLMELGATLDRVDMAIANLAVATAKVDAVEPLAREAARGAAAHVQQLWLETRRQTLVIAVIAGILAAMLGFVGGRLSVGQIDQLTCQTTPQGQLCWVEVRRWF